MKNSAWKLSLILVAAAITACGSTSKSSNISATSNVSQPDSSEISSITPTSSVTPEPSSSEPAPSSEQPASSSEETNEALKFFANKNYGEMKKMPAKLADFTPTRFQHSTLQKTSEVSLGDGVKHQQYQFRLTNSHIVQPQVIEVDPAKARICSTYAHGIDTVNNQIIAYEESHPETKVMAGVNADYFATGSGGSSVNGYVFEKNILKAGHNDNGVYDYKDLTSDIPASKPMLLGISGAHVKISGMIQNGTPEQVVKSQFSYSIFASEGEKTPANLKGITNFNKSKLGNADFSLDLNGTLFTSEEGETVVKIQLIEDKESSFTYGKVTKVSVTSEEGAKIKAAADLEKGYIYLIAKPNCGHTFKNGDYVGYTTTSPDDTWLGYTEIIGGRHSLVENGEIAPTVTLENTNGAQRTDVPRTCAGVTVDGKVLIVTMEALRYGGVSKTDADPYGLNLPELAEFMRYIGCYDALNFDGGGSTQLITSDKNGTGTKKLNFRCSDYGTTGINDCRKVYSSLLVTTR